MLRFQLQRLQETLSQGHTICGQHWSPQNEEKLLLANSYCARFWSTPWPLQAQSHWHIHVQPCWYLPTPHNQQVRHQCRPSPQLKEDPGLTQEIHKWSWHTMSRFWTSSHLSKCGRFSSHCQQFCWGPQESSAQVMQHFAQLYQMKLRQQQHAPQVYDLDVKSWVDWYKIGNISVNLHHKLSPSHSDVTHNVWSTRRISR